MTEPDPADIVGIYAVKALRLAGFTLTWDPPRPPKTRARFRCQMCGYAEFGGLELDAFADWGLIWHRACVDPDETSPMRRGSNRPMTVEQVPA